MTAPLRGRPSGSQSLERGLDVIAALLDADGDGYTRVSDLAQRTHLKQPTVSRLCASLERGGYLQRDDQGRGYRLGDAFISLGSAVLNRMAVYTAARQPLQELAQRLGLGMNLAQLSGAHIFYLLNVEGALLPRSYTLAGQRNPAHATGLGKCLLSGLRWDEVNSRLGPGPYPQYTPNTITSVQHLQTELASVRERGYATETEELARGRACVAAPVRDGRGQIVAAVSISGPLSAMQLESRMSELAQAVIELGDHISGQLGYQGAHVEMSA
jgi:DNA-binding IclR family transcriptional regulator